MREHTEQEQGAILKAAQYWLHVSGERTPKQILLVQARFTLERLERRLLARERDLSKTLVKQASKYSALKQKVDELTILRERALRRLVRRHAAVIKLQSN